MSLSELSPTKKHLSSATLTPSTPSCALATKRHAYGHATDSGAAKPTTNRPATWQLTPRPQSHAHLLPHHPPRESLREWRNVMPKPTDDAYSHRTECTSSTSRGPRRAQSSTSTVIRVDFGDAIHLVAKRMAHHIDIEVIANPHLIQTRKH